MTIVAPKQENVNAAINTASQTVTNSPSKVLVATWLGWMFDGMDSFIYPLVANQALGELIGVGNPDFGKIAAYVIALFLVGWSLGGYIFGFIGDRFGRVKALSISILTYAIFTGFSGLAHSWQELAFYRFLSGLGIGGEWALGVALLAETAKAENRIKATGILATGFSIGSLIAIFANYLISPFGWRFVFFFGVLPAFLVFYIIKNIKEPPMWASMENKITSPLEIFKKEYARNLWVAFLLGVAFSIGSWTCVLFWFPIWLERSLGATLEQKTIGTFVSMGAHIIGSYFGALSLLVYRRKTIIFFSFLLSFLTAAFMYSYFKTYGPGVLVFSSLLGFFFGVIPAAFAVYFPELFPTKIRSTAKGFCYSTARLFTAAGVLYSGLLVQTFSGNIGTAAAWMSFTFLLGALIALFAPNTNDKTLPA